MKASIKADIAGHVTLTYDGIYGYRVKREFTCSENDGYVYETVGNRTIQVCEKLAGSGNTWMVRNRANLLAKIRQEYRKYKGMKRKLGL